MQQHGEPSVEEILESIKRVIDRENRQTMQAERRRRESEGVRQRDLAAELGMSASEDDLPQDPDPAGNAPQAEAPLDVLDLGSAATRLDDDAAPGDAPEEDEADDGADDGAGSEAASGAQDAARIAAAASESLISDRAEQSMRQSLAALTVLTRPAGEGESETALQTMTREMLRPMLAEWLDEHLPDMVERLVKAEIARIAGIGR